jgi:acyl-CoA dehydrogenase
LFDFSVPPRIEELARRVAAFVDTRIVPYEKDPRLGSHGPSDELRRELVALAREEGLLSPHVAKRWGGLGLTHAERAVVFEAAGRSLLGPVALNCNAPDEGNMHLLEHVASEAQKEQWLRPLAAGEIRSCFAMTEPAPGAGSDPGKLLTTYRRDGNSGFVINGRKWLITGAEGAACIIVMARDEDEADQATMFLLPMDSPGVRIVRLLDTMDANFTGGHAELEFEGLRAPADSVLGEVGQGFRYAQVRLAPARLTHCMRWLGAAGRAHRIAVEYAARREAFGRPIAQHEGVGYMLADNEMDLHQSRLAIWHAAWLLDRGEHARHETSMAKVTCSEATYRVVDRCVQILGGLGVTDDTVVARIFRDIRAVRIYDGPSEVHRWAIARHVVRHHAPPAKRG